MVAELMTRYGYDAIAIAVVVAIGGIWLAWTFSENPWLRIPVTLGLAGLLGFTLNFFRDPERVTPKGEDLVISPADGKVIKVKTLREDEYLKDEAVEISIFMSPLNVHVNRIPISGRVGYYRYIPGEYLVAFDEKSSSRNERTHIGIDNGRFKVFFKQIAGFVARRIIAEVKEGLSVTAGERFGMIRFGSRVDIFLPKHSVIKVREGDMAVAGSTILAEVP
jgi:phosphatidylserine decarboxylase